MELSLPRRKQILYAVIAVLIAIVFLFPVYWLVQLSFKPDMEAFGKVLTYYPHTFIRILCSGTLFAHFESSQNVSGRK